MTVRADDAVFSRPLALGTAVRYTLLSISFAAASLKPCTSITTSLSIASSVSDE